RAGVPRCPEHGQDLAAQSVSQMVDQVLALAEGTGVLLLAPIVQDRKGEHAEVFEHLRSQGFVRARIDGRLFELDERPSLDPRRRHTIEAVIDRLKVRADAAQRLAESFETALALAQGSAKLAFHDEPGREPLQFSNRFACTVCGYSLTELEPRLFSFNNPNGACGTCGGLGMQEFFDPARVVVNPGLSLAGGAIRGWDRRNAYYFQLIQSLARHYRFDIETPWVELPEAVRHALLWGSGEDKISFRYFDAKGAATRRTHAWEGILPNLERRYRETESATVREELARYRGTRACGDCGGSRLNQAARNVFVAGRALPGIASLSIAEARRFFGELHIEGWRGDIAQRLVREIADRLTFLSDVGLDYLSLDRSAETLSGGEAQRIRLASQIGSGLVGVMYLLDEPSIGLHQRDNQRLLDTLVRLRDLGNTVIVVEHDEDAIRQADYVVDLGPGAGAHGGLVVAQGTPAAVAANPESLTGAFLSGRRRIALPKQRRVPEPRRAIRIVEATGNNLRGVTANFPIGLMTCVTGVSGSGKSTLVIDTLYRHAASALQESPGGEPAPCTAVDGLEQIDRVIDIDQGPIGRTPRSNPATYTGIFGPVRELFAEVPEARARGYDPGRFSFNVRGGRCEACEGDGLIRVEMHFLPDAYVTCDACRGMRYNRETLEIRYKGRNIHDV
ncbi:MAG: excinuclease ABC subunit UvrA, partial [Steroidobacteraceae bacterium]